jgi:hypothetical protein
MACYVGIDVAKPIDGPTWLSLRPLGEAETRSTTAVITDYIGPCIETARE